MSSSLVRRLERSFLVGGVAVLAACGKTSVAGSSGNCCTEHEWTTTADVAKTYASKDAPDKLGCPSKVEINEKTPQPDAGDPPPWGNHDLLDAPTQALRAKGDTSACVYRDVRCCPGGRPLFAADEAEPVVAARTRGGRWSKKTLGSLGLDLDPGIRTAIARGWLDDAFAEHASVASFARATLELMSVGAPPALLAAHQRAGMQEIRHAERCFALARAYGVDAIDPGPLVIPLPRTEPASLLRLACDLVVEGCIAETIGALMAERALERCTIEPARAALRVIAADEAAHAALAWKTLAWALRAGGAEVVAAVLARAHASRPRVPSGGRDEELLAAHGRLSAAAMARVTDDAWRLVIDPLLAKLYTPSPA